MATRASPPLSAMRRSSASCVRLTTPPPSPRSASPSARRTRMRMCSGASASRRTTRARDSSAAFTSKLGFSVVAPSSRTTPLSTWGRIASCWALLKRWISSMNRTVRRPTRSRSRPRSTMRRRSATPAPTALTASKAELVMVATMRARVVLPLPGGPQRTSEGRASSSRARRSTEPGPTACSCPTNSSRLRGRIRVDSGAAAVRSLGDPGAPCDSPPVAPVASPSSGKSADCSLITRMVRASMLPTRR